MEAFWSAIGSNQAVILIAVVLGLLALFVVGAWLFRKIAGGNSVKLARNRQPRLSVTDAAVVDDKRRLVLVRRDNVEHLVMIGGPTDIVIEQNIVRSHPVAPVQREPAAVQQREAAAEPVAEPEPMPSPVQRLRQPAHRQAPAQVDVAQQRARKAESQRASTMGAVAAASAVAAVNVSEPQSARINQDTDFEEFAELPEQSAPQPAEAAIPDFEFDLAAEMARDLAPQNNPMPQTAIQMPPEPSLEDALGQELEDELDFAKMLGAPGAESPAMVTPDPMTSPSRKRQESVDDEMQRLLDELSNA